MDDHERDRLLARLRGGSTLGAEMAERVEIDGTTVNLKSLLFELHGLDTVPEPEHERIEELLGHLRRERISRRQQIAEGDISVEEGEELVAEVIGIDRAINALGRLDARGYEETARESRIESHKQWLGLVKQLR
ncbi:DUF5788 family protein [Halobaculum limi]|uniref:DUF5788 family protein n=1 Tax=Halobaculum limi TaxID=3031916 RepID=UPI002404F736|nr:DUF5788 family protein [Halobaculum sp. YSMS11]